VCVVERARVDAVVVDRAEDAHEEPPKELVINDRVTI
jgi:hypothetical protein